MTKHSRARFPWRAAIAYSILCGLIMAALLVVLGENIAVRSGCSHVRHAALSGMKDKKLTMTIAAESANEESFINQDPEYWFSKMEKKCPEIFFLYFFDIQTGI